MCIRDSLATCQLEQDRMMQVIRIVAKRGYMGCAKALMTHLGVPVGPARLPNANPDAAGVQAMLGELEAIGYFSWKN
jgi:N-acetylneuraminate lyase